MATTLPTPGPVSGRVAVVTGGASGIGAALARRFAADGARAVVVVDRDQAAAEAVAAGLGCEFALGAGVDVTDEHSVQALVSRVEFEVGDIDLWCSNAGVPTGPGLGDDEDWAAAWRVHVLAHVYAARHVLPGMVARGGGHFLVTASAAGLLTELDSAPYPVTKHAAVALTEWLAIRYGGAGVGFSCLCPQAVRTPMTAGFDANAPTLLAGTVLEPSDVADAVMSALAEDRFLILPHAEVAEYEQRRAADRDRWLRGMRRFRSAAEAARVEARPSEPGPATD